MPLNDYLQQTQRYLHDAKMELIHPGDLVNYVNQARREAAARTQSIRILPPISGPIASATVTTAGTGYTSPTVTITPPDFPSGRLPLPNGAQATGTATELGGVIDDVQIVYGGDGYFEPIITINDPTGTGAVVRPNLSPLTILQPGQEEYPFSGINLSMFPGVGKIIAIQSISIIYSNYRYSLPIYSFSVYQAKIRQYPFQYQWVPTMATQRAQGANGSFLVYPIPSQPYQVEFDCFCWPSDLESDNDTEALPAPWTDGVPLFAAHLAFLELQNFNAARMYLDLFDQYMSRYGAYSRPTRAVNPYGRY